MTTETITIHNVETGEIITRDMNAEELAQLEADRVVGNAVKAKQEQTETDRAALLARLGITAEEAQLLLGGN
jgi:FMN-dependent NADH-azoreductase